MIYKVTIKDSVKEYNDINLLEKGINNTLFELTGQRKLNFKETLDSLLQDNYLFNETLLKGKKCILPGTRLDNEIIGIELEIII